ncbi:hypothetical protein PORY_001311 [Pneumocystis oryctolagi]|uniref:Uncharacterized protein n=1 Tax=Pneumocystis oryctolagi TaxID=42067 RepID=A0ACB7CC66_9ASCO|nr:hypothetical protein PORY_001311 [Pneumocystis oryctolagi]
MFSNNLIFQLQRLTVQQLRTVAMKCGILNNGNKSELINRIFKEISKTKLIDKHYTAHRILSIDMGIRNLALCSIILPPVVIQDFNLIYYENFIINEWCKLSINLENIENDEITKKTHKLTSYSFLAYQLAKSFLEKFQPQTILIERQRYRTRNMNTVLEWTIKINMFEHMLHAIFRCFKEEKIWNDPEADILSIDPTKITSFWLEKNNTIKKNTFINHNLFKNIFTNSRNNDSINLSETPLKSKKEKIKIVDLLLKANSIFDFKNTQITADDFISRKKEKNKLKVDDLADSFLQAVSWIIWEQNKWKLKQKLQHNKPLDDFINDYT